MKENNYAFIDGQNLYLGTKSKNWLIDFERLKIYLSDKYSVNKIFYFWGYYDQKNEKIYNKLIRSGYILIFKEHNKNFISNKKGNIDSNLVFEVMKKIRTKERFDKILVISGDGDYKKMINYLINKNKLKKILFPNGRDASSLYKKIGSEYYDFLDEESVKEKVGRLK